MADSVLSYRIPSQEAFHYRKVFYSCQREQIECNEKWFRRIENCVNGCDFGRFSVFMLLDKFISGLNNDIIDRLRPTQTLTVAQLMTIANDDESKNRANTRTEPMFLSINVCESDAPPINAQVN